VLRVFAAILGKRLPDVVLFLGEVSLLLATDVSLVAGLRLDQLALRHCAALLLEDTASIAGCCPQRISPLLVDGEGSLDDLALTTS
jgi:hypothetical protein